MSVHGRVGAAVCAFAAAVSTAALGATPAGAQDPPFADLSAGPVPVWLTYDRPAEFGVFTEEIRVPMRDGVQMRCTRTAPAIGGAAQPGRYPVVVTNFFVYRAIQNTAIAPMATRLTERGYVTLACSPRGSGGTPGVWRPFETQESQDNYDLIEWAAAQPWSTGKIGQTGVSYGGISTYKAVATAPPHLAAAVPIVAYSDLYSEFAYPGGTRSTKFRWWPSFTYLSSLPDQSAPDAVANAPAYQEFEARAAAHPTRDDYWKSLAIDTKAVNRSKVPILGIGGWHDLFPSGMVKNYRAAKDQSHLLMLPSAHVDFVPGVPDFAVVERALLAWFDRLLMKRPGAPAPATKVTSWELPRYGGRWVQLEDFPPAKNRRLALVGPEGIAASTTFAHALNPFDNGCTCLEQGTYGSPDLPINDQRQADAARIKFDDAPVGVDTVIAGTPVAHLRAALSVPDANLVVRLQDVGPDGTSSVITTGWLRASHRKGHEKPVRVTPGQVYDYRVEMLPTHWRLRPGHFLRITVSTGDLQAVEPISPLGGTLTLFAGKDGSTIEIPYLP